MNERMARTKQKGVNNHKSDNNININSYLKTSKCNINIIDVNIEDNKKEPISEDSVKMGDTLAENTSTKSAANESNSSHKINVYFIEINTTKSSSAPNASVGRQPKAMQMAFTSMKSYKFTPHWIQENEVLAKEWTHEDNSYLFIIDSFDGKVFDYLRERNVRMIGPLTVLYCYSSDCQNRFKTIPEKPIPIYSQCMRKLFVSISGFDGQRKVDLIMKIERMCGNICKDFTKKVTHLVTDSVRTKKYKVAKQSGTTVLSSDWVEDCWTEHQHQLKGANGSDIIDKYGLKIFKNLMITVSQVDVEERTQVMQIVRSNGGQYSPSLKLNVLNSILLLKEPNGEKFKYAHMRGIPCLDIKWLYDSVDRGYALPEDDYAIAGSSGGSQRSQRSQRTQQICKGIQNESKSINQTNERSSQQSVDIRLIRSSTSNSSCVTENTVQNITKTIEDLLKIENNESFLEGCNAYVVGFDRPVFEAIKSALISCGSLVFNANKDIVNYVIVGPNISDTEREQLFENKNCKLVSIEWLFECLRNSCQSDRHEIRRPEESNSCGKSKNNTQDIFDGPLTVICPEAAQKASEKWRNSTKMDAKHNHKSLGETMNHSIDVQWNDGSPDDIPSQRPYPPIASNVSESSKCESFTTEEDNRDKTEDNIEEIEVEDHLIESSKPMVKKCFLFSGYDEQTKNEFKQIVEQLDGLAFESNSVLDSVSHLIIRDPSATEKTLSAIASGIWVLKEDYLYESQRNKKFLTEEEYEWGHTLGKEVDNKSLRKRLMISAINWRKYLTEGIEISLHKSEVKRKKVFDGWNVLVLFETKSTNSYTRVLRSGNANVVLLSPDLNERQLKEFEYALVDQNSVKNMPKYALKTAKYLLKQQKLFIIDFVSHYILNGPNSDLKKYMHKVLVKESVFNDLEPTQQSSGKRSRAEMDDNPQPSASKYRK